MIENPSSLLINSFQRNLEIIELQTDGLSHRDSLIQLPFRANCLNWVVGHILVNRCSVFRLLEWEDLIPDLDLSRYQREADPILKDGENVHPLSLLMETLQQAQVQLRGHLEDLSAIDFHHPVDFFGSGEKPLIEWLFFFYFHETYHTGQTELLRQAAGTDDKII